MDQWHPRTLAAEPRPSAQTEHFSEFNAASRQIPQQRGHLHKQLYGSSQKSATNTTSNHTSKHLHRPNQTNQRQQLYQPPAIIKQLERSKQSKLTAPPAATTIKQNCADRHLRGAYQDESIRNDTCLADQLPFARTQRKILAFFYIYAIVVASLFLTYVAYCFVQSHQWRRNQQQQSRSVSSSSAPLRAAPDEFSELQSARQAIELEAKFESRLALLERYIEIMAADLEETKVRLREREKCRCHIGCSVNGTQYDDGANWQRQQTCDNCSCQSGKVTCTPIKCPKLSCDPSEQVQASGKCCPLCMSKYLFGLEDEIMRISTFDHRTTNSMTFHLTQKNASTTTRSSSTTRSSIRLPTRTRLARESSASVR